MPYVHRTVVCGETVEHRKMYSSRVHSKEVKPRKRSSEKETSKRQERINERVAEEHLRWLINCNYHYGDFHLVLHYWCKQVTLEQAERDRAAFLRELRKAYTKAGKRLKYVAVLETKHMTNVHHHILLPRFDAQIIAAAWTKVTNGAGSISFQMLDDRKNHAKLASYLIKESRSTMRRCREQGIRRLMSINLLKRLESSLHSFQLTLGRIEQLIAQTLDTIAHYDPTATLELNDLSGVADLDADDQESDLFTVGRKVKIELADMDYVTWRKDLEEDQHTLRMLLKAVSQITPAHDSKLRMLLDTITEKIEHPINPGNKKVIIFTAFSDTAQYLYDHVSAFAGEKYGLNTALVTGSVEGRTTIPKFKADLNNVLTCFSPRSKDKAALMPDGPDIDLLIATDCISEGQNLQDCDCLINYDIHWNPVCLVQRFGRIDRIGSKNDVIQLINFWPDMDLDSYINLKGRVETRMKALVMTSTGDDNLLSPEEQGNLEYRREQLKRLQTEVVDLEEMGTGVSITDLGLNEFRMEVMEYAKRHPELETTPGGISAVTQALPDAPAGVVFVLKNVHNEININDRNRLHPYYLVYLTEEGEIVYDHLSPRSTLETMRQLCHGKTEPIQALCRAFNEETRCGEEMQLYSDLLEEAVLSIVDAKEDSDLDSLFRAGGTTALLNQISGLDDFELICFLVVKEG